MSIESATPYLNLNGRATDNDRRRGTQLPELAIWSEQPRMMTGRNPRTLRWPAVVPVFLLACGSRTPSSHGTLSPDGGAEASCARGDEPGTLMWQETFLPDASFGFASMYTLDAYPGGLLASGAMPTGGWMARLDDAHQITWQETAGPSPASCHTTPVGDGAIFAACRVTVDCPPGSALQDCDTDVLHRYYDAGNQLTWEVRLTADEVKGNDSTGRAMQLPDGDIVVPYTLSKLGSEDPARVHLRAYDSDGNVNWDKVLSASSQQMVSALYSVVLASPNTLYATGEAVGDDPVVLKMNAAGDVLWVHHSDAKRTLTRIAPFHGGVALAGSDSDGSLSRSSVVEVLDADGHSTLEVHFPSERGNWSGATGIATTADGRMFVAINDQDASGLSEAYVAEVSSQGKILWRSTGFGTNSNIVALSIRESPCSLLVAGEKWEDNDAGTVDVALAAELSL